MDCNFVSLCIIIEQSFYVTYRMLPAAIGTGRVIDKDLVLSGYKVPKGVWYFI